MEDKKLTRRDFLKMAGGAAAGSALIAACAGETPTPRTIVETVEVVEEVEKEVETVVTATPPPQEPVTIRFIATAPEQYYNVDAFSEQHPLITVEFEDIGNEAFEAAVLTRVAGGDPPELAWASGQRLWRFVQAGAAVAIDDLATAYPHGEIDLIDPTAVGQYSSPDFFPPGQVMVKPGLYGWPVYLTTFQMVFNKRILSEGGVDEPRIGWTWADFRASLVASNNPPDNWGFVMPGSAAQATVGYVHNMLWSNNADVYDSTGKCALASPEAVETLQFLQDLVLVDGVVKLGEAAEGADFMGGNLAYQYSGNWVVGWYDFSMEDPYGIVPMPNKQADAVRGGIDGFTFLAGAANPWAGWELAKWMSSFEDYMGGPGGQKVLNDEDQVEVVSVNTAAAAESYVNPNFGVPEGAEDWFPEWALNNARYEPWIPSGPGFNYNTAYDGLWEGDDVEDTLTQIATSIDSINEATMKYG
ncbi:MAG: extracellular solute-binding protein [Anaerolineales bacterium]|nr:extracellular solute-binding protein [Anaerolineales bacterium]